jgi:hypothetical protein
MNHEQTRAHKTHHGLNLKETTTFPLILFSMLSHRAYTQMSFFSDTPKLVVSKFPKFSKLGLLQLWKPITSFTNLQLRWGLKKSYNPCWELSNDMLHTTYTQVNHSDSWLLVVGSQIDNLIIIPSFSHNLCFKYPNGSCEFILDIQVSRAFQQYKEIFNLISFDPFNRFLKIRESIETPTLKMWAHLGVCGFIPSHSPTLPRTWSVTPKLHSWLTPLQAFALVTSPTLRLWQIMSFMHMICMLSHVTRLV